MPEFPKIPRITVVELRELLGVEPIGFRKGFYGGSRVICNPPPTDTDCDIALLVLNVEVFAALLKGWERPSAAERYDTEDDKFRTFRKGEHNLMVFSDESEYGAVLAATAIAKQQNLMKKEQRYRLFEIARSPWR